MSRSEINEKSAIAPPKYPSLPYMLFKYRQKLQQRSTEYIKIAAMKLHVTDNLISETMRNIGKYEVMSLSREVVFKRKLSEELKKAKKLEKEGVKVDPREFFKKQWYPLKPKLTAIEQE